MILSRIVTLSVVFFIPFILTAQDVAYSEYTFPCGDYNWELVWSDEFDDGVIDDTKWFKFNTWYVESENKVLDFIYLENNLIEHDGCLKILTQKPSTPINISLYNISTGQNESFTFPYTSGSIYTYQKNEWLYGKFEARIKIAGGYGLFPAYWLYGPYPYWNEIDIFEFYKTKKDAMNNQETHCKHQSVNEEWQDRLLSTNIRIDWRDQNGDIEINPTPSMNSSFNPYYDEEYSITDKFSHLSTDFHVYTLEWDPYKIVWKLDGEVIRTYYHYMELYGNGNQITSCDIPTIAISYMKPLFANYPMELYFNTAILQALLLNRYNCLCPDEAPDGSPLPESMDIDYIRIFKKAYCGENIYISNKRYKEYETEFIPAERIDAAGNNYVVLLDPKSDVTYTAGTSIGLHPGFHAVQGSNFKASISPCNNNRSCETNHSAFEKSEIGMIIKQDSAKDEKISQSNDPLIYPNPGSGCFSLGFDPQKVALKLIDENGRDIAFDIQGQTLCCNASDGKYYLRFLMDGQLQIIPLIIKK